MRAKVEELSRLEFSNGYLTTNYIPLLSFLKVDPVSGGATLILTLSSGMYAEVNAVSTAKIV